MSFASPRFVSLCTAVRGFASPRNAPHRLNKEGKFMTKPSMEISADVRKLVEFLQNREHATYAEMNRRVGRQLDAGDRHVLYGALRVLGREHEMVFVTERGVGIKRATNGQVAVLATDRVHDRTRRAIKRGRKFEQLVNTQELTGDQRDAFFIGCCVTQMLDATVGKKMRSKIADEIKERGGEPVNIADVITLFTKRAH